jgi:hypothetical protein
MAYWYDDDLVANEARHAVLLAAKAAEEAARAQAPVTMLKLAILNHGQFCKEHNPDTGKCSWFEGSNYPNDFERCNWTNQAHQEWLGIALQGKANAEQVGLTVTEA